MKSNMAVSDQISIEHIKGVEKFVRDRDGKVGVAFSPHYGGGLSYGNYDLAMDRTVVRLALVQQVQDPDSAEYRDTCLQINRYVEDRYGFDPGVHDTLSVDWLAPGTRFIIHEYDGWESITVEDSIKWGVA